MRTNIPLIQALIGEKFLPEYAMWLLLKQIHINSRTYDYSIKKIHKQSGISRNGLRKYLSFFKEMGWAREEIRKGKPDLVLISHDKLKKIYGIAPVKTKRGHYLNSDIKIAHSTKHKEILENLQLEVMRDKQRKFDFLKKKKDDLIEPRGQGAVERLKSAKEYFKDVAPEKLSSTLSAVPKYYTTSTASIARQWNVKPSTASRRIKKFEKMGKVKVKRSNLTVEPKKFDEFGNFVLPKNCFFHKNCLFKNEANQYIFY